jgi:hypothetical protein
MRRSVPQRRRSSHYSHAAPRPRRQHPSANRKVCSLLHARFLLRLLFGPESGGGRFLRNVGCLKTLHDSVLLCRNSLLCNTVC